MQKNKFDNRKAKELGELGENLFYQAAIDRGYSIKTCKSYLENAKNHSDFYITKNNITKRIEVKGPKRINSTDTELSDELICIELMGIAGFPGWLYGKADIVAFCIKEGFCLVQKDKLITLVESIIDINIEPIPSTQNKVKHVIYRRVQWNRMDKIVYITKEELLSIKGNKIWKMN